MDEDEMSFRKRKSKNLPGKSSVKKQKLIIIEEKTDSEAYEELTALLKKMEDFLLKKSLRHDTNMLWGLSLELKSFCLQAMTEKLQISNSFKILQVYMKHKKFNSRSIRGKSSIIKFLRGVEDGTSDTDSRDPSIFIYGAGGTASNLYYSLDQYENQWYWTPDKTYYMWMPCSTTEVSYGTWKGQEPASQNIQIIKYLNAVRPPSQTQPSEKPSICECNVVHLLSLSINCGNSEVSNNIKSVLSMMERELEGYEYVSDFCHAVVHRCNPEAESTSSEPSHYPDLMLTVPGSTSSEPSHYPDLMLTVPGSNTVITVPFEYQQSPFASYFKRNDYHSESSEKHLGYDLQSKDLDTFPEGCLEETELIDLTNNCLCSLPESNVQLPNLTVLNLCGNVLSSFPKCINYLHKLTHLDISNNKIKSIDEFEFCQLKELKFLNITNSKIKTLPCDINELVNLEILLLGYNPGLIFPRTLEKLTNLRTVSVEENRYELLPQALLQASWIANLSFRCNLIKNIPDELKKFKNLSILKTGGNKILYYPSWLFVEFTELKVDFGDEDDICIPPPEIWSLGMQSLQAYYKGLTKSGDQFDERLKVLVLGDTMAGKTSLVRSILSGKCSLTEPDERTTCVDVHDYSYPKNVSSKPLTIKFWDFGGDESYYFVNSFFISPNALILLVVDTTCCLNSSSAETLNRVRTWTSIVLSRIPNAKFIVVGTHIDQIEDKSKLQTVQRELTEEVKKVYELYRDCIEGACQKLDSQQLKHSEDKRITMGKMKKILTNPPTPPDSVVFVSNSNGEGHEDVISLLNISVQNHPRLVSYLPLRWKQAEEYVCSDYLPENPLISVRKFYSTVKKRFTDMKKSEIECLLHYFAKNGTFCHFSDCDGELANSVFLDPNWLLSKLKLVFVKEEILLNAIEKLPTETSRKKYNIKKMLINQGILSKQTLSYLWKSQNQFEVKNLINVLEMFSLCFEVKKDLQYLFPHLCNDLKEPQHYFSETSMGCSFILAFKPFVPPGILDLLRCTLCQICAGETKQYKYGAAGCTSSDISLLVVKKVYKDEYSVPESSEIIIAAKMKSSSPNQWRELWKDLLHLLLHAQKMQLQWPGLVSSFHVLCPQCVHQCHSNSCLFDADWLEYVFGDLKICESFLSALPCKYRCPVSENTFDAIQIIPPKDVLNVAINEISRKPRGCLEEVNKLFHPSIDELPPNAQDEACIPNCDSNDFQNNSSGITDIEFDLVTTELLHKWKYDCSQLLEKLVQVLNVNQDSAIRARQQKSDHMKVFAILTAWNENAYQEDTNMMRTVLFETLVDSFTHNFSIGNCFWKKNQQLEELAGMTPLEQISKEIHERNKPVEVSADELDRVSMGLFNHLQFDTRRVLFYLGRDSPPHYFKGQSFSTKSEIRDVLLEWLHDCECSSRARLIQVCRKLHCKKTESLLL